MCWRFGPPPSRPDARGQPTAPRPDDAEAARRPVRRAAASRGRARPPPRPRRGGGRALGDADRPGQAVQAGPRCPGWRDGPPWPGLDASEAADDAIRRWPEARHEGAAGTRRQPPPCPARRELLNNAAVATPNRPPPCHPSQWRPGRSHSSRPPRGSEECGPAIPSPPRRPESARILDAYRHKRGSAGGAGLRGAGLARRGRTAKLRPRLYRAGTGVECLLPVTGHPSSHHARGARADRLTRREERRYHQRRFI
jgi:hypothetical protein